MKWTLISPLHDKSSTDALWQTILKTFLKIVLQANSLKTRSNLPFIKQFFASFVLLFISFNVFSTNYYVSSSTGNDSNAGTSENSAWQTIEKVNSLIPSPGDQILFKCGDSWVGTLTIKSSGTASSPITYSSYGTGSKPKIYGSKEITGWTLYSGNIYKATVADNITQLFIDDNRMQLARYPNSGYFNISTVSGTTQFSSTSLSSSINYSNAQLHIKVNEWRLDSKRITSSSGQSLTIDSNTSYSLKSGLSFFLCNKLEFLDKAGQWYFDLNTKTVYVWTLSGDSPANHVVRGSVFTNGIEINSKDYISIRNLEILQHSEKGINISSGDYLTIENNEIYDIETNGISANGNRNIINNNTISGSNQFALTISGANCTISNNMCQNTALFDNLGLNGMNGFSYVMSVGGDNNLIQYNKIINAGYTGLSWTGKNCTIEYNYAENLMQVLSDGGAIYTYSLNIDYLRVAGTVIRNNIIQNLYHGTAAIYMDERTRDVVIENNTISNCRGYAIFLHDNMNIEARNNVLFNNSKGIRATMTYGGNQFHNNILCNIETTKDGTYPATLALLNPDENTLTLDDNTYVDHYCPYPFRNTKTYDYQTFESWKSTMGQDANSTFNYYQINEGDIEKLFYNTNKTTKNINLGTTVYRDVYGNRVTGTLTLEPFTSKILIQTSEAYNSNQNPVINNQSFQIDGNAPANQIVGQVLASDPDTDQSLSYEIIQGNTENLFYIDAGTGQLFTTSALQISQNTSIDLIVRVTDNDNDPLTASATITINITGVELPDVTAPSISTFSVPATAYDLTVPILSFVASDNQAVAGYLITETAAVPDIDNPGWTTAAPDTYTAETEGTKTLYAWVKDAAGNISALKSAQVLIILPDLSPVSSSFSFEEISGSNVFDSNTIADGNILNSFSRTDGACGKGLLFDGAGYISLGNNYSLNVKNQVSLSAWIKPNPASSGFQGIIMHGGDNIDTYALYINPGTKSIGFKTTGTTNPWTEIENVNSLWDGNWHQISATYNGEQKNIYLDGEIIYSVNATGSIEFGEGYNLLIAAGRDYQTPTLLYNGLIDEVKIYNYAISPSQITESFQNINSCFHTVYTTEEVTICQGSNYQGWTAEGEYQRTLQTAAGYDSIVTTNLFVNPVFEITEDITIKQGEDYLGWTQAGTYERLLQSVLGCDSLVITNLTVLPTIYTQEEVSICEGETYLGWTESGQYERTLIAQNGADSVVVTFLYVNPNYQITEDVRIAEGESYNGWTQAGTYQRTLTSSTGCDSIVTTNLIVMSTIFTEEEVSICEGESYLGWNQSGEYQRTLTAASGADSVVITLLHVHPSYHITEDITINEGEDYHGWTESGVYERMLNSTFGCDSLVTTNLTVLAPVYTEDQVSICEGESYNGWNESGEYWQFFTAANGADSIVITMLNINPTYSTSENITIKQGENYFGWTQSGTYERVLTSSLGCDSIVTTNLTVLPTITTEEEVLICQGESYLGWTESGEYERAFTASNGADSIVITLLHVNPTYQVTEDIRISEGENYLGWNQTGTYQRVLSSSMGCDSIVTTNLTVMATIFTEEEVSICEGESYLGWTQSGEYERQLTTSTGADSVVITLLHVNQNYQVSEEVKIKEGESYMGWTQSGTYERNLTSTFGCDSVVITNLTVLEPIYTEEEISICQGESYLGWTESGEYGRILTSSTGADSIITTLLYVNPVYQVAEDITIKQGEEYLGWSQSGTYQRMLTSQFGCDSMVITNLNVLQTITTEEEVSICEGESYLGWTESGEYEQLFSASNGADSIVITLLHVNPSYQITENIRISEGESYMGWTQPGTYHRTLSSSMGCDSVVTTNLTVMSTIFTEEEVSICEGESYLGWTQSGEYERTLKSAAGTDSVVITLLYVHDKSQIVEDISIKEGENYNGWTQTGTYERLFTSSFGCDSLVITNLTVLEPIYSEGEISICEGESYNGWTESGEYRQFFIAANGADSIVNTILYVNLVYHITENIEINAGENYNGWTESGVYERNLETQFGCDSVVTTNLTVVQPVAALVQNIELKQGWNIFSSYLIPEQSALDSILKPICEENNLIKVLDENRDVFKEQKNTNTWDNQIGDLQITEGYKIKVENDCVLPIKGHLIDMPVSIPLKKGVNLISFPYNEPVNALTVIEPLIDAGTLYKIQDERGNAIEYWKSENKWENRIGDFIPGEGYQVIMKKDDILEIQDSYKKSGILYSDYRAPEHFCLKPGYGPDHMNINIINLSYSGLQVGDEIAAFDGDICVGAIKLDEIHFNNNAASINAALTDAEELNGFTEGHEIELRIWSEKNSREETYRTEIEEGQMVYQKRASVFVVITSNKVSAASLFDLTSVDVYPNPAHGKATVHFSTLPQPGTTIVLFDMAGNQVMQREVQSTHEVIEISGQPAGMYLVKTIIGNQTKTNKLIIR